MYFLHLCLTRCVCVYACMLGRGGGEVVYLVYIFPTNDDPHWTPAR